MRPLPRLLVPAVLGLALFGGACTVFKKDPGPEKSSAEEQVRPAFFSVPAKQLEHLTIVPVQKTAWSFTIRTTGTVDWNADRTTPAITQVSGPVTRILAGMGSSVTTGAPLLYVASPDMTGATASYRKARNRLELAKLTLDRNRDLLEHKAIARKDFESVQADYKDAVTEVQNALEVLTIYGITRQQVDEADRQGESIDPQLAVRAPIDGTVVQKLVAPGQLIQAGATTCFLISDTSTVWIQGHIYDSDLGAIRIGDAVDVTNPSFRQVFHGKVTYIAAMVDAATRTTPVRIVTENRNGLLKKDMFVDLVIHTRTRRGVLTVPTSAVLHNTENQPFVFAQVNPGEFAQRLVTVGAHQDDQTEIVSGCKEGEPVVSEGAVFLQFASGGQ
jgi:cobalt-zinc-cadmium efflux system membrane fusion protein